MTLIKVDLTIRSSEAALFQFHLPKANGMLRFSEAGVYDTP